MSESTPIGADADDPVAALRDVRNRFVLTFSARCDAIAHLTARVVQDGPEAPLRALHHLVHRLTGLSGLIGFPDVSAAAGVLETHLEAIGTRGEDPHTVADGAARLREAFARDLQRTAPEWHISEPAASRRRATKLLLVEDDADQAKLLASWLRHGGYQTISASSGEAALAIVSQEHPDLVLLDVGLPGLDGHDVCQRLRADPDQTRTPIIFLTTRASIDDRLLVLSLGADDYVTKPVDRHELLLRVRLRLRAADRDSGGGVAGRRVPRAMLAFDAFALVARAELERHPAALALVRAPAAAMPAVTRALLRDTRRGDAVGHLDRTHLALLQPNMTLAAARDRLRAMLEARRVQETTGVHGGIAIAPAPGASLDALLAEADQALAWARLSGDDVATSGRYEALSGPRIGGTAVFTEEDPYQAPMVDAMMRSAGLRPLYAADGARALAAVRTERPDVLLLDLSTPALGGFEVLQRLASRSTRPHIVVLLPHGRDAEVARAFELGADDYVTKPLASHELRARLTRLLR